MTDADRFGRLAALLTGEPVGLAPLVDLKEGTPARFLSTYVDGLPRSLPLVHGTTVVGRSFDTSYAGPKPVLNGIVEARQWQIRCEPTGEMWIQDNGSTSGSVLVPSAFREQTELTLRAAGSFQHAQWLGWDGHSWQKGELKAYPGDILVNAYRWFLVG